MGKIFEHILEPTEQGGSCRYCQRGTNIFCKNCGGYVCGREECVNKHWKEYREGNRFERPR